MVKAMKYRDIERALRHYGCEPIRVRGDHETWNCPCGSHHITITRSREVSSGIVRSAIKRMACLPEGWLQ
jgi:predicted RNA binding protein YcfA (HicA-like mRNA interferase family)